MVKYDTKLNKKNAKASTQSFTTDWQNVANIHSDEPSASFCCDATESLNDARVGLCSKRLLQAMTIQIHPNKRVRRLIFNLRNI